MALRALPGDASRLDLFTIKTSSLVCGALVGVICSAGEKTFAGPALPTDTTQALEVLRKQHDLPALAVIMVKDGEIRDRVAVGVRKSGNATRVTTNDVFHIGSCTKSMTATLTAMLIAEGKLRWDTTIAGVFPELTHLPPFADRPQDFLASRAGSDFVGKTAG